MQMMGHYGDQTAQSRLMQGEWALERERTPERPGAAAAGWLTDAPRRAEMSDNMLEMHRLYQAATAGLVQTVGEIKRRENPAKQDW